ncbi:hypothetical protein A3C98_01855 [Candidatus Roizmanbacteria bacterium RIFCSPHIGHO2_02_FULL_37_15]|uniref:Nickel/cobalt efflux system n=1 Tax=Candidatus Roizmanbacteria bacterium RIFCSPLOWO2_01_FULL_37_16 TaxID=1802058 RepID=A0A1F7IPM6_9BACT|nr:MAG: hypothetical protein A3C98_01855 [Candidatus Roizmanbacteria bacterium RIFCSPHIGHO2_02_FULL_37_15]OGK34109.1 MAG: hypothetical protein A3F57_06720 [Candidatus Roizmanbacteria bacterium RIFCSPHIGHO2_12_FULL_36_11]OGK45316.1 MAG: hypothetical protein A3B40_05480 [Candidatus Roizmanbacteria bacterium RIFCSPLOWO2_01_FULL_37_16]
MPFYVPQYAIVFLAFLLGLRHGIDWDHIAAITDLTGTSSNRREAFILGFLYIIGHVFIIIILGLAAIFVGINLPDWLDPIVKKFVGITLILLGLWLIASIVRSGRNFKIKSRWMLILDLINKISLFLHNKIPHQHTHKKPHHPQGKNISRVAFTVGMIHGIGAETPTQVLIFIAAAGVGRGFSGILLLFTFVFGLMLSNTIISLLSIFGYAKTKRNSNLYLGLGLVTAFFSIVIGLLFIFNRASVLPSILGV